MSNTCIEVLRKASHKQLEPLIEFLDRPLDMMVKVNGTYLDAKEDLTKIPDFIDSRIGLAGGHTVANWTRGLEGPSYREVVADVCKAQKVKIAKDDNAAGMEFKLLKELFERRWAKMTGEERIEFIKAFKVQTGFTGSLVASMPFSVLAAALGPALFAIATTDFAVALGGYLGAAALGEAAGALAGPVGLLAAVLVLAHQALGPSLRATTPCVLYIASLRLQQKMDETLGEAL